MAVPVAGEEDFIARATHTRVPLANPRWIDHVYEDDVLFPRIRARHRSQEVHAGPRKRLIDLVDERAKGATGPPDVFAGERSECGGARWSGQVRAAVARYAVRAICRSSDVMPWPPARVWRVTSAPVRVSSATSRSTLAAGAIGSELPFNSTKRRAPRSLEAARFCGAVGPSKPPVLPEW